MRQTHDLFLVLSTILLLGGCNKTASGPTPIERREKATEAVVHDFKQRLVALESKYPALAGVGDFPYSEHGFTFVNNAIDPRLHISVGVDDTFFSTKRTTAVGEQNLEGTSFTTVLEMECSNPRLKQEIESAYALLREDLRERGRIYFLDRCCP